MSARERVDHEINFARDAECERLIGMDACATRPLVNTHLTARFGTVAILVLSTAHCAVGLIAPSSEGGAGTADAADEQAPSQDDGGTVTMDDAATTALDSSMAVDSAAKDSATATCPSNWASPTTPAGCHCGTTHMCTANGCYGGYWCDTSGNTCHATPPAGCM